MRLAEWFRLRPARRRLVWRAAFWVVAARLVLAWLPFRVASRLAATPRGKRPGDWEPLDARWAVNAVANRVPGTRCLARSLALQSILSRSGFDSELRVGAVKAEDGSLRAHAWVLCGGKPLADEDAGDYVPLT